MKTKTIEVTKDNFAETIRDGVVLLDFWASWCGPCRAFAPVFEAAAGRNPDVTFGKVDTEDQRELAALFQVQAIPTLVVLRDGVPLLIRSGMLPGKALDEVIEKANALDMEVVLRDASPITEAASAQGGV